MRATENNISNQYLSFVLRGEQFTVEITKVREVLDLATLTSIPRMPEYMSGVINLRGAVVPVVDLGLRLGMGPIRQTINTCIMIIEIEGEGDNGCMPIGVLTDQVQEVFNLAQEDIEPPPRLGSGVKTDFIKGMGRLGEKFMILIDIDKVLAMGKDLSGINDILETAKSINISKGTDESSDAEKV